MIDTPTMEAILLVLLGGLFGWTLGKLPEQWVYVVMAVAFVLGIVVLSD